VPSPSERGFLNSSPQAEPSVQISRTGLPRWLLRRPPFHTAGCNVRADGSSRAADRVGWRRPSADGHRDASTAKEPKRPRACRERKAGWTGRLQRDREATNSFVAL